MLYNFFFIQGVNTFDWSYETGTISAGKGETGPRDQ